MSDDDLDEAERDLGPYAQPGDDSWRTDPADDGAKALAVAATPWTYTDPREIPPRAWLYGHQYLPRFVSATISPGGVGKSSLILVETIAVATGLPLLGITPRERVPVWYWNGEDPLEELERRVAAILLHYDIAPAQLEGRLFLDSGRETPLVIARETRDGTVIVEPVVEAVKRTIRENRIGLVSIDPFVSSHQVTENDNNAIDRVVKEWGRIAEATGCAIGLSHHARKTGGAEVTVEHSRGGVALIDGVRVARALNTMTPEEAERAGVGPEDRRRHFRVGEGKANLTIASDKAQWFRMASVDLGNGPPGLGGAFGGDSIGVVTPWEWPDPLADVTVSDLRAAQAAVREAGPWRENVQATDWVGRPIARALRLDPESKLDREKVKRLLRVWIGTRMFVVVTGKDAKGNERPFVEVGEAAMD